MLDSERVFKYQTQHRDQENWVQIVCFSSKRKMKIWDTVEKKYKNKYCYIFGETKDRSLAFKTFTILKILHVQHYSELSQEPYHHISVKQNYVFQSLNKKKWFQNNQSLEAACINISSEVSQQDLPLSHWPYPALPLQF